MYNYSQALRRSRVSREQRRSASEFSMLGRHWLQLPDVFSPADTKSTLAHLELLTFPVDGSFLEIGCGTGIIAISAALAGCGPVYATDLNPAAVRNTALNAARFGVRDRVTCVCSDLFDALSDAPKFDVVYWHSNNVWTPTSLELGIHELAYVDPGYAAHRRFIEQARHHLTPNGRALLAISSRADRRGLDELAAASGQCLVSAKETVSDEPEGPVTYELLELRPTH